MTATNRSRTAYVPEVTRGVTPVNPVFREMRVTSNALVFEPSRVVSNEIRADRQVTDAILTNLTAGGSIGFELSFAAFDDMIEAALQGTWANNPTILNLTADTEISDVSTTTITVAAGGAAFSNGSLAVATGFGVAANNRLFRVASATATTIAAAAATFTAEAVPPAGARLRVVGFEGVAGDIQAVTAGGNALTSTTLNFTTFGLVVGEWVRLGGTAAPNRFATAANNGWARVSAIAANRLSFDQVPAGWAADTGAGQSIQCFMGDVLVNGVTQRGFTVERQQQDHSPVTFEYFRGMEVDTLALNLTQSAILTGSVGFAGLSASVPGGVRLTGATDIPAPAFPVLNASSNVARIAEGGVAVSGPSFIMEMGVEINNNLARQNAVGVLGSANIRTGELGLSGTLNAYFGDPTYLSRVINDAETSLFFAVGRQDGNRESYVVDIPRVKVTGSAPVPAKNADRMFNGSYQAMRHPTLGYTILVSRFHFLP